MASTTAGGAYPSTGLNGICINQGCPAATKLVLPAISTSDPPATVDYVAGTTYYTLSTCPGVL